VRAQRRFDALIIETDEKIAAGAPVVQMIGD
jgi:hypothetical protein